MTVGRLARPHLRERRSACVVATETEGEITVRRAEGSVHRSRRRIERRLNQPSRISLLVVQSLIPRRISARRRKRESIGASNQFEHYRDIVQSYRRIYHSSRECYDVSGPRGTRSRIAAQKPHIILGKITKAIGHIKSHAEYVSVANSIYTC